MDSESFTVGNALVPAAPSEAELSHGSHSVPFLGDDASFLESLSEFAGGAVGAGNACLVIATQAHRQALSDRLLLRNIDVPGAIANGRYIAMDAQEMLARFMVDGTPDRELFAQAIEPVLQRAKLGSLSGSKDVTAFDEMVTLLWSEGFYEAAIQLEKLWGELVERLHVSLRCGYPLDGFTSASQHELLRKLFSASPPVVASESSTSQPDEEVHRHLVRSLQQKASVVQLALEERERAMAQRLEAEARLRRTEQFAKHVVESSDDCVKVLDRDGRLDYMSPPGLRALEFTEVSEVLGKRWVDFWRGEDRERAAGALADAMAGGVGSFQGECRSARGTIKSWDVRITPVRSADGEVERLVAVSRDVTELRNAQQVAVQAEKLAAAGRMAATIAHEINNPLEAVTNLIYLAKTTPGVPKEACRQLDIADRELARVAQLAQQTLGFYRDNSRNRWVNIAELIQDVLLLYERKLRIKQIETRVACDPSLAIYGKQGELKQALSNLTANAIDASARGGTIWLRAQGTRDWSHGMQSGIRITLADNGSGMTPEVKRRIFVPFFTTKPTVGTGIGLWVTKSLIEQQGGHLQFRSQQGQKAGTVMSFFVPTGKEESSNEAEANIHA